MENAVFTAKYSRVEKPAEAPQIEEEAEPQATKISPAVFVYAAAVLLAGAGAVAVILIRKRKTKTEKK